MIDKPGKRLLVKPPLFYWFGTNDILIHVYLKKILLISPFIGNLIYHTIEKAIKKNHWKKIHFNINWWKFMICDQFLYIPWTPRFIVVLKSLKEVSVSLLIFSLSQVHLSSTFWKDSKSDSECASNPITLTVHLNHSTLYNSACKSLHQQFM